jgi:hypothetical protein
MQRTRSFGIRLMKKTRTDPLGTAITIAHAPARRQRRPGPAPGREDPGKRYNGNRTIPMAPGVTLRTLLAAGVGLAVLGSCAPTPPPASEQLSGPGRTQAPAGPLYEKTYTTPSGRQWDIQFFGYGTGTIRPAPGEFDPQTSYPDR